jgi:hypothetical protein
MLFLISKDARNAGAIYAFCPERLDTGELPKEPAPRDILLPDIEVRLVKGDSHLLHGGKPRRENATH